MNATRADRVVQLGFETAWFIDGAWADGSSESNIDIQDPSTGEVIAALPRAGAEEALKCVEGAERAFRHWSRTSAIERAAVLQKVEALLRSHREALAQLTVLEQGMPIEAARANVDYAASFFRWFAEEARRIYGYSVPQPDPRRRIHVDYFPRGVAGVITPWNAPLASPAKKVAAALAAGCTVVLKPSELTPISALALAWIVSEAGAPPGAFNVVGGDAPAIGRVLTRHPAVRTISFTGSLRAGRRLYSSASRYIKHVALELGGNAPFIIFDDADLGRAVENLVRLKQANSGQICVTANRVYIEATIFSQVEKQLVESYGGLKLGDGFASGVEQGPLISASAVNRVAGLVEEASQGGARVLCGGRSSDLGPNFYPPTVVSKPFSRARILSEEIFGPVLTLLPFENEEEAIASANETDARLAAYAYTTNASRLHRLRRELQFGVVGLNDPRPIGCESPFGGVGCSGIGREGGREGLLDFMDVRTVGEYA